jgi:hypothetical protein
MRGLHCFLHGVLPPLARWLQAIVPPRCILKSLEQRADERTRTADLISLRVITQALQGCAEDCKYRIFRGGSFLRFAACCTLLRSRWYQSGINIIRIFA